MQSLLIVAALLLVCYVIVWIRDHRHNLLASLRSAAKNFARRIMSFSWIIAAAAVLLLACYPNVSGFLKEILSAQSVRDVKSLVRIIFGVDSSFVALQMLAMYSIITSLVSCLLLSMGVIVRVIYVAALKVAKFVSVDVDGRGCDDDFAPHQAPTFKLYLRYNS